MVNTNVEKVFIVINESEPDCQPQKPTPLTSKTCRASSARSPGVLAGLDRQASPTGSLYVSGLTLADTTCIPITHCLSLRHMKVPGCPYRLAPCKRDAVQGDPH